MAVNQEDYTQVLGLLMAAERSSEYAAHWEMIARTFASKAYYYLYITTQTLAEDRGYTGDSAGKKTHTALWGWLQKHSAQEARALGDFGRGFHATRIAADYYVNEPFTDDCASLVTRAIVGGNLVAQFEVAVSVVP